MSPKPRLTGTRHILAVRDLRASTDFYMTRLGCRRDFGDESDGWSWLSRDEFRVGLRECPEARPASELGDHSYVAYITVVDIDTFHAELKDRGAAI
jgi:catechol 2,3-dioxygenase-like lactoylglutathione lyase family enzyme